MQLPTSRTHPPQLAAAMAAARRPSVAPEMPRVHALLALSTSPTLHRLLPRRLAYLAAEIYGRLLWRCSPGTRERARATMEAIAGATARAPEIDALARRHVIDKQVHTMLFWQPPPRTVYLDERSRGHLRDALESGRGVILSTCHLGPYFDLTTAMAAAGCPCISLAGPWFFQTPSADYAGRRLAHWQAKVAARDSRLLCVQNSFAPALALLAEGETLVIYFDVMGPRHTLFLGKPMTLADGTARLAKSSGALVLPARARRDGDRVSVDFSAPLDSRDYTSKALLHAALADIHSALVLEVAETLEDPRRAGAWERGATADGWLAPSQM